MSESKSTIIDEERQIGMQLGQAAAKRRNNRISLPKVPIQLDEERIFTAANDYNAWGRARMVLKNLPPFDNSANFGITQADENFHIREEIKKFVQFMNVDKPPLFDSYGAFHGTNNAGYDDLYNIVDQIRANLQIVRHDNACLAFDHYVQHEFYEIFQNSRANLRMRYLREPRGIVGHNPVMLDDETRNMKAYHALVDYVFHSLAWWLMHVSERKSWYAPIIAVLARWSVKLKLVALNPVAWAERSLARGEDIMRRINEERKEGERISIDIQPPGEKTEPKKVDTLDDRDQDFFYYMSKTRIRDILYEFVRNMLNNLIAADKKGSTAFEVRTLLYRNDLDETLRQLTVQQNGNVGTSSDTANLSYSYRALQFLLSNAQSISPTSVNTNSSEAARVVWRIKLIKGADTETGSVTTTRLDDVISMLIPVSMMGCSDLVRSLDVVSSWLGAEGDLVPATLELDCEQSPRIEFSLTTRPRGKIASYETGSDRVPTSRSPLITSMEDVAKELAQCDAFESNLPENLLKSHAYRTFTEYKARTAEIKSWSLTEDSVRVNTTKYSSITLAIALSVIGGSLSVPFLVGESIPGVDPFQFVTFGWLLAGAFLVGAKSRYVESWPWHDFLRGQIVCRSVSELAVASRVPRQAVLLYLLHQEFRGPLLFRGPCRGPFHRKSASSTEGFNIDVPVEHATILAAGFIVLEVHTKEMKAYTLLHDTRESTYDMLPGKSLISDPLDGILSGNGERKKMGYKEEIRLSLGQAPSEYNVAGLLTADCNFI